MMNHPHIKMYKRIMDSCMGSLLQYTAKEFKNPPALPYAFARDSLIKWGAIYPYLFLEDPENKEGTLTPEDCIRVQKISTLISNKFKKEDLLENEEIKDYCIILAEDFCKMVEDEYKKKKSTWIAQMDDYQKTNLENALSLWKEEYKPKEL